MGAITVRERMHAVRARSGMDFAYYATPGAHLYVSACLTGKLTTRFYVSILIAPRAHAFELEIGGERTLHRAAAIKPLTQSGKRIVDGPLLTLHLEPSHPAFRGFRAIPWPGVLPIDRELFAPMNDALFAACEGRLALGDAANLIDDVVSATVALLPMPAPQDPRVVRVCELLRGQPNISLPDIAVALNLSYDRTSHLFTEAIGLPFRNYQLWLKVRRANRLLWSGQSLTSAAHSAGFADSAHLCRTYQQVFGHPPSYFFDGRFVRIFAPSRAQTAASAENAAAAELR